jgi:hypothetical protein
MRKKVRTILFFIFLLIFIVIAPLLILHVQGYRLDFENKKLTQTGALFIKTISPKQAEIYVDNELIQKTDFFFNSALIENLLPKKYNIKVQKQDYYTWEKNLEIKEKEVTEGKSIILFPQDPEFKLLSTNIDNAWFSKDKKKVVIKESEKNAWSLKLYNLEKNVKSHLLKETDLSQTGADLIDLEFTDNNNLLLQVANKEQINYFNLQINRIPPLLTKAKAPQSIIKNALVYKVFNENIYYLDYLGDFYKTDVSLIKNEKIASSPFNIKQETEYRLYIYDKAIFLLEEKTVYFFNQDKKIFEKFSENINSLKISPDQQKIAYFSDSEIKILFLEEQTFKPRRQVMETIFLIRLSENIKDVFWINSNYLLFTTNNALKIAEIDNRDQVNTIDLVTVENPEIFLNLRTKKLYLLDRGNLFVSEKIL